MLLLISEDAVCDLDEIFDYWSERATLETANRLIGNIGERFSLIRRYPHAGISCIEFGLDIRSLCAGKYVIYYRIGQNRIEIVRVLHGSRHQRLAFRSATKHR